MDYWWWIIGHGLLVVDYWSWIIGRGLLVVDTSGEAEGRLIKHVWRLAFEIWDRSHGGDLDKTIISTFLVPPIDLETGPPNGWDVGWDLAGDPGEFGGGLGVDSGN